MMTSQETLGAMAHRHVLTFNFVKIYPFQVENLPSTFFLKTVRLPSVTLY